jgi:sugar phosphate isomerase/epimerase
MQLGFVTAILGDLSFQEVLAFAADEGFACVELMCWPPGGETDRRYAGVTHLDVLKCCDDEQAHHIRDLLRIHGVAVSALGYYPNPLDPDPEHRRVVTDHLRRVIDVAAILEIGMVTTFIGRDRKLTPEANLPRLREIWPPLVAHAAERGVTLALENCPMLFSHDEWPGGNNLMSTPALWRRIFEELPSPRLGLNFDPSHLLWQQIDAVRAIREFGSKIVHVHAKDERIDRDRLYEHGVSGVGWHTPKLPGLGEVDWPAFFAALTDVDYRGAVCIEVEDRAYEGSLDDRKRALRQSKRFLEQFMG